MAQLFNQLSKNTIYSLNILPKIIDKVFPLKSRHKADLPFAISDLSKLLTVQRSELKHSYWSSARFSSAYLRYFFPWNVIRLAKLLQGLDICEPYANLQPEDVDKASKLDMRNFNKNKQAIIATQEKKLARNSEMQNIKTRRLLVDLGSGPLTLPIALWLAKPEWRNLPLSILCLDTSPQPLEYGKQIFYALAGNTSPWQIITRRASLNTLHKELRNIEASPWLLTGANVINELFLQKGERYEENFSDISFQIASFCNYKDAMALFVEPGTRLGGKNISLLREKTIENNLKAIAPCVHDTACPLQDSRSWCHFTFDIEGAPRWLLDLSHASFLTKTALSLSFVLMQNCSSTDNNVDAKKIKTMKNTSNLRDISKIKIARTEIKIARTEDVRIVSAPFKIPTLNSSVRYACSSQGLIIVKDAVDFTSGSKVKITWDSDKGKANKDVSSKGDAGSSSRGNNAEPSVDKKTGVRIVEPYNVAHEQNRIVRGRKVEVTASTARNNKDEFATSKPRNNKENIIPSAAKNQKEQNSFVSGKNKIDKDKTVTNQENKEQNTFVGNKDKKEPNAFVENNDRSNRKVRSDRNDTNDRGGRNDRAVNSTPDRRSEKEQSLAASNKDKKETKSSVSSNTKDNASPKVKSKSKSAARGATKGKSKKPSYFGKQVKS